MQLNQITKQFLDNMTIIDATDAGLLFHPVNNSSDPVRHPNTNWYEFQ